MTAAPSRTGTLTLLHTAPANIATFDRLLAEIAPDIEATHVLASDLLDDARAQGLTTDLRARIGETVSQAVDNGATVVLCTCSTIGDCAEAASLPPGAAVLRVDRAMAEAAVAIGGRIGVAAALESTLGPTEGLIRQVASDAGKTVALHRILCTDAWPLFEAGDRAGFLAAVAGAVRIGSPGCDVVVLAQASMEGATDLLGDLPIPVLSSPRLGLEAALDRLGQLGRTAPDSARA